MRHYQCWSLSSEVRRFSCPWLDAEGNVRRTMLFTKRECRERPENFCEVVAELREGHKLNCIQTR